MRNSWDALLGGTNLGLALQIGNESALIRSLRENEKYLCVQ